MLDPSTLMETGTTSGTTVTPDVNTGGIAAGYEVFGWPFNTTNPTYMNSVTEEWTQVSELDNSNSGPAEYLVAHEWARQASNYSNQCENAICAEYINGKDALCCEVNCPNNNNQAVWCPLTIPGDDQIQVEVCANLKTLGQTQFNSVNFYVWDITKNQYWTTTINTPFTEVITNVDYAHELDPGYPGTGIYFQASNMIATNINEQQVMMQPQYAGFIYWQNPSITYGHMESFYPPSWGDPYATCAISLTG